MKRSWEVLSLCEIVSSLKSESYAQLLKTLHRAQLNLHLTEIVKTWVLGPHSKHLLQWILAEPAASASSQGKSTAFTQKNTGLQVAFNLRYPAWYHDSKI